MFSICIGRVTTKSTEVGGPFDKKWCCDSIVGPCYDLETDCRNDCGNQCKFEALGDDPPKNLEDGKLSFF